MCVFKFNLNSIHNRYQWLYFCRCLKPKSIVIHVCQILHYSPLNALLIQSFIIFTSQNGLNHTWFYPFNVVRNFDKFKWVFALRNYKYFLRNYIEVWNQFNSPYSFKLLPFVRIMCFSGRKNKTIGDSHFTKRFFIYPHNRMKVLENQFGKCS